MVRLRIENLDKSADVDVQKELEGKWISRGVKRLFKGDSLEIEGEGQFRIMVNGEGVKEPPAPAKTSSRKEKKEEEEPSE